ncbi:pentapeptide repeat-containing protein [Sphaerisporangium perillae]|uniref:pentapeptide repeat-containing protein n=1 Tax=Sphaerisporangium perillae TaxID=2935860 RepID=UPI00200FCE70|nr:pentapeptide repeat-containing protein [Sphaerisporangium perillae]
MPSPTSSTRSGTLKEPSRPKVKAALTRAELPEHDLVDDATCRSLEYKAIDLSFRDTDAAEFEGCRFIETGFSGTRMRRGGFSDVDLQRCDLSNMVATSSTMHRTWVSAGRLTGMTWSECAFRDVLVEDCRVNLAGFRFSTFKNTVFRDCDMREVNFQNADLRGVRFERCDLTGAQFSGAQMAGARFADCVLLGIGGVTSLAGVIIKARDAQGLVYSLASAMGIVIEN